MFFIVNLLLLFFFQFHTLEPCHPDACALFIGGDNLANLNGRVIEDWMKKNESISKFNHVLKKKRGVCINLLICLKFFNLLNGEF
jgi:hypothetical protein